MTKLYQVVAHNLNEARKARDGKKKGKMPREPEKLKIGDNVLVRDHMSKVFQPKYKDFCIVGLLGKNQVEIKDNHGHTTKVHCRDVKKIPMIEKVCQLYEEEQIGKVREGRKTVPSDKMPDLGWDIAETQLQEDKQDSTENNNHHTTLTLQVMIAITIVITTLLHQIMYPRNPPSNEKHSTGDKNYIQRNLSQQSNLSGRKSYKAAVLAVAPATNTTESTSHTNRP